MPAFGQSPIIDIARRAKAFLNNRQERTADQNSELEQARQQLMSKDRELAELRARLVRSGAGTEASGIDPGNIVWIFGSGRSGNTWLSSMMGDMEGHAVWREPNVGFLFGYMYYVWAHEGQRGAINFILGRHKESWLKSIRNFVLDEAQTRFPTLSNDGYLVVKEPNGSVGAPLLMEALPESRMILLVRDPRDVAASTMDARRTGGWSYERNKKLYLEGQRIPADEDPDTFVENPANQYMRNVGNSKLAYDAHRGRKALVKYEDLRADTLATMKHIYSALGILVDEGELGRVVEKHSWENIPEDKKGEGKFYRKATPEGWREDLTPQQAKTVERITAPLLEELYPDEGQSESPSEKLPLN
jgi:sulfotransferase family protein